MKTPGEALHVLKTHIKKSWKIAFLSAFLAGLLIHLPVWTMDAPNHDGLASVYFDQNMITSGRWFLTVACGISSYYTLPWLIGIFSLLCVSITCVILIELLEVKHTEWIVLTSVLFVSFPALASTYAYIFTADGYMFALLLSVLAVYLTKRYRRGFWAGGLCLAFSMGTYQAYLSVCMLLCLYVLAQRFTEEGSLKEKAFYVSRFLGMGVTGVSLYYVILQILLKAEGKALDTYQGISDMTSVGGASLIHTIRNMYKDFFVFVFRGNILSNNIFSLTAALALAVLFLTAALRLVKKYYKSWWFWGTFAVFSAVFPLAANIIIFVSPQVGYHLLMRYQYVFLLLFCVAFVEKYGTGRGEAWRQWLLLGAGTVFCVNFAVSVNIGYGNLQKRYEKTYAYCVRLADRIEQTEGYYTGMPVVIMGVVGEQNFPPTDITTSVTGNMIGLCGDYLCYTGPNYKDFFKHYLGITIEVVEQDVVGQIYNTSEIYQSLDSFPGANCTKVVDGMLYVKTENKLEEY